jgi:hypothetical protein
MTTNPPEPSADLSTLLRMKILEYKAARPNLSSQQIAKKFSMPKSTFSRLENMEMKIPSFDQTLKILTGTGHQKEILPYLTKHYPEFAGVYEKGMGTNQSAKYIDDEIINYLVDPHTSKMILLSLSTSGLKKSVIIDEFGKSGLKTLEMLIDKNILVEKNFETYFPTEFGSKINIKNTRFLINRSLNEYFDIDGHEKKTALNNMNFQSESINLEKAYPLILSLVESLQRDVRTIFNDPEYQGEDTVFVGSFTDTLLNNNILINKGTNI